MALNTAGLFDNPDFSDITIKFSGREIKCHKVILCTKSEFFRKLCAPSSHFSQTKQKVFELHEDDPKALYEVLRQVYTLNDFDDASKFIFNGIEHSSDDLDLRLQFEISTTARKYLLPKIADWATHRFYYALGQLEDPHEFCDVLQHVKNSAAADPDFLLAIEVFARRNVLWLLEKPVYRAMLEQDSKELWRWIDEAFGILLGNRRYDPTRKVSRRKPEFLKQERHEEK